MAVYGHKSLIDINALDLHQQPWVGPGSRLFDEPMRQWMAEQGYDEHCAFRVDTLIGMLSSVKAGVGVSVLPCYLADGEPELIQLSDPIPQLSYGLWFLMHPDLRGVSRIQSLMDFMTGAVREQTARLAGYTATKKQG